MPVTKLDASATLDATPAAGGGVTKLSGDVALDQPKPAHGLFDTKWLLPQVDLGDIAKGVGELPAEASRQAAAHQGETLAQRVRDPAEQQKALDVALSFGPGNLEAPTGVAETVKSTPTVPITVSGVTPQRAALAKEAIDKFGIPITATQIGASGAGKYMESMARSLPLSGAREHEAAVRASWNQAVSRTFGENAPQITQSVMQAAKRRIGGEINRIENTSAVTLAGPDVAKLAQLEQVAHSTLTDSEYGVIRRQLDNVIKHIGGGSQIAGQTVGNLLRRGGELDRAIASNNSNIAHVAQGIKAVVQDALQASLGPTEASAYRNARFQYKNMKTVEPLVNKAPTGDISPALLSGRVSQQFVNRAYDTSGHDLDQLGKIGQAFLKEPGTSGTAERGSVLYAGSKLAELVAAVASGHFLGIPATLVGGMAALGAGRAAGAYLRSPSVAEKTINRVLAPAPAPPPGALNAASGLGIRAAAGSGLDDVLGYMPP